MICTITCVAVVDYIACLFLCCSDSLLMYPLTLTHTRTNLIQDLLPRLPRLSARKLRKVWHRIIVDEAILNHLYSPHQHANSTKPPTKTK
jgi:hypothetical protein